MIAMNPVSGSNLINKAPASAIQALTQQVTNELSSLPIQLPAGALANASPGDLVKLSAAAMQYQETTALFADPSATDGNSANSSLDSLLASIGTPSQQAANSGSETALQNEAALLGLPTNATTNATPNALNVLA